IVGNVHVPAGKTLSIQPGTVIKFNAGLSLTIDGTLSAPGAAAQPIVFTSFRDDSAGGDTNGDGPSTGSSGDWGRIALTASSTASVLDHVEVRFGGASAPAAVTVTGIPLLLTNSLVRDSSGSGIRVVQASPTLSGDTFQNNGGPAISMDLTSQPAVQAPTFTNNPVNGVVVDTGTLPADATWASPGVAYVLFHTVTVPAGVTLTLGAGQVIKTSISGNDPTSNTFIVQGKLVTQGSAAQPVVITSYHDDTAGGDTNNNGNGSTPGPGDTGNVAIAAGASGQLDHVEFRYGAFGLGALRADGGTLSLSNSLVRDSGGGLVLR